MMNDLTDPYGSDLQALATQNTENRYSQERSLFFLNEIKEDPSKHF